MAFGFILTSLRLSGPTVPDAVLRLQKGLNVIAGPSDTGKTYIAQCIDFALGATSPPKEIPEAAAYTEVSLGITSNEQEFELTRSLKGGDVELQTNGGRHTLKGRHQPSDKNTLSYFLLSLSGLEGRTVRMNQAGKTREISFRDLARLTIVDEETVISERSPIHSGQVVTSTVENSVFQLLLTGVDESAVRKVPDPKITKGRLEGRAEIIATLLDRVRTEFQEMFPKDSEKTLEDALARIESHMQTVSESLDAEKVESTSLEEQRRDAWSDLRQIESRRDVLTELDERFKLLQTQYSSDIRRLEAIAEAGTRLTEMKEVRCPVCGALAEHQKHPEAADAPTLNQVVMASMAEADKIRALANDLTATLESTELELSELVARGAVASERLGLIATEIDGRLQPRIRAALQELQESRLRADSYKQGLSLLGRIAELEVLAETSVEVASVRAAALPAIVVPSSAADQFSREVESLLRSWHFPDVDRVAYSEADQDLIISGRRRGSHGKGVRAIFHAAFNLGLLAYCNNRNKPHPGWVMIDSPLVVYREPDPEADGLSPEVKDAFYRGVTETFSDQQVIILENEDPPLDVELSANVIRFSGSHLGVKGFIP